MSNVRVTQSFTVLALMFTGLCGCVDVSTNSSGENSVMLLPSSATVALGARLDVAVLDACGKAESDISLGTGDHLPEIDIDLGFQTCDNADVVGFHDVVVTPPEVFSVAETKSVSEIGVLTIEALAEGQSTIDVFADTSVGPLDASGEFGALPVTKTDLSLQCGNSRAGNRVLAGASVSFNFTLWHDEQSLIGYGYYPFDLGPFAIEGGDGQGFEATAPNQAGAVTVTSTISPESSVELVVTTLAEIDDPGLSVSGNGCMMTIEARPSAQGETELCVGDYTTDLVVETPSACAFFVDYQETFNASIVAQGSDESELPTSVALRRLAAGTCRVTGTVRGTTVANSVEMEFEACEFWEQRFDEATKRLLDVGTDGRLYFTSHWMGIYLDDRDSTTFFKDLDKTPIDVWGVSSADFGVLLEEELLAFHSDGVQTTVLDTKYYAAHLLASGQVLLAGGEFDGWINRWTSEDGLESGKRPVGFTTARLQDVWGDDTGFITVFGRESSPSGPEAVLVFDGTEWQKGYQSQTTLFGVWGSASDDVFVVGDDGLILHYDGSEWSPMASGVSGRLIRVTGTGPNCVVAMGNEDVPGDYGFVLRFDGMAWSPPRYVRGAGTLNDVIIDSATGRVLVAGAGGVFMDPN